ncbi:outer membrane lipoprotein-sorting protein [bacterium]|jgi:outer membrane lipoprotein-sorting protein|nr:outer membrane lipoprotein-sorting protein [bacterium]
MTALWSLALWISVSANAAAPALDTEEILAKVDNIRNPGSSFLMTVDVSSGGDSTSAFEVFVQGNNKTLVKTLEPPRDRGRNLLMLDEEMWAFVPNLKRSVRVSLSQKLTGQTANGDISRMRWKGDYEAVLESETPQQWILLLSAKKKGLTYDKVRAWVEKKSYRPLKAEFLTSSGKALKTAVYEEYKTMAGAIRPTQIRIQDAIRADDRSVITIQKMEVRTFPTSLFNQNSLQ